MSENVEIEFKNLLTKEEYQLLIVHFKISNSQIKKQINHYFDTPAFSLKKGNIALRVREKGNHYEMTLKQPAPIGLLETNQTLQKQEADVLIKNGTIPDGEVKKKLSFMANSVRDIEYFGTLTTNRVEIDYKGGILVFDHSTYLNVEDYEVEYEVNDPVIGKKIFLDFLSQLNIPSRKTENKVQRFYRQKYHQS